MPMLAELVDAVIGIETHRDRHEVEIADAARKPVAAMQIINDSAGFAQLVAVIVEVESGPRVSVCIEGIRRYGIGLARALAATTRSAPRPAHRLRPTRRWCSASG